MDIKKTPLELVWQLRHEVMWPDKHLDYVKIKEDYEGVHYGLYEGDRLISVVSLFLKGEEAQFRKFATQHNEQRKGYGSKLLTHVLEEAERAGVKRIFCNARVEKAAFYEKFGLRKTDDTFIKDGKSYIMMEQKF